MSALLVKGSIATGRSDELSDIDLVIVTAAGECEALWSGRRAVAEALGSPLGVFEEAPWQAPFTAIALYDGPMKVDLFFHDGEVAPDPWLTEGFLVLVDKAGVAERLREALASAPPYVLDPNELLELDAHAWDWLWWLHVKLRRGETWLVWTEMSWFFNTIVVRAFNLVWGEPWRGATGLGERLEAGVLERMREALPSSVDPDELARALPALADLYVEARGALAAAHDVDLPDELMRQVRPRLGT